SAKRLEDPDRPADVDLAEHLCRARVGSAVPGLPHGPGDHCPVEPSGTSACWLTRQVSAAVPPEALRDEIRGACPGTGGVTVWRTCSSSMISFARRPCSFYSGLKVRPPAH